MNTVDVYKKIKELGIELPEAPNDSEYLRMIRPMGDKLLYLSGMGPNLIGDEPMAGHIPSRISIEDGEKAARNCALNALSVLHQYTGDLNQIKSFVKILGFVSSDADFIKQHLVMNGASGLLIDVFGEEIGKSARSAVGVSSLPNDFPVEVEMVVELK